MLGVVAALVMLVAGVRAEAQQAQMDQAPCLVRVEHNQQVARAETPKEAPQTAPHCKAANPAQLVIAVVGAAAAAATGVAVQAGTATVRLATLAVAAALGMSMQPTSPAVF